MTSNILFNINNLINKKGLKKCFVAEQVGMSLQQFSDTLNGRRVLKPDEIPAIAQVLEVTPNDLFGFVSKVPVTGRVNAN